MSQRINTKVSNATDMKGNDVPLSPSETKQKRILSSRNSGHFSMIRALHLADVITLGNGFCGIMSIFSSLRYCLSQTSLPSHLSSTSPVPSTPLTPPSLAPLFMALSFLPLGLFFDFLDGRVARWRQKSSVMGAELDSLADLISFGVAPACVAFTIGLRTPVDHLCLCFFALCGLTRLARFNVTANTKVEDGGVPHDKHGKALYFEGTPIPSSLGIVAVMAFWAINGWVESDKGVPLGVWGVGEWWEVHPVVAIFVLHGCAMVSKTLHVPKP